MDDRQAVTRGIGCLGQLGLDPFPITDQHRDQLGLVTHGLDGARDDRSGSKIASHRVQGYPHDITPTRLNFIPNANSCETTTGCRNREVSPSFGIPRATP